MIKSHLITVFYNKHIIISYNIKFYQHSGQHGNYLFDYINTYIKTCMCTHTHTFIQFNIVRTLFY